jgi:hypothetical protein
MIKMGKRKYGFLTEWQRDFLSGLIQLKPSKRVSVKQRERIELREIFVSASQANEDFRILDQWEAKKWEDVSTSEEILKRVSPWGRTKGWSKPIKRPVTVRIKCPECGLKLNALFGVNEDGKLVQVESFGRDYIKKEKINEGN